MTRFKTLALIGVSTTLLVSSVSFAKPEADTNNDGEISQAEFFAQADAKFNSADTNGDRQLTKDERTTARENHRNQARNKIFDHLDSNSDGVISRAEFEARSDERRERVKKRRDINGDGEVDKADRKLYAKLRKEKRKKYKEMRKQRKEMKAEHGNYRAKLDANGDGIVTYEEHTAVAQAMFTRLDVNGDGVLSKGEGHKRGKRGDRRKHR